MDPVGAFLIAAFVATGVVRGWFARCWARLTGNTEALNELRMQERQHEHELRMQREQYRHEEQMAGRVQPSAGQYIAAGFGRRIADGPLPYERRTPWGKWFWRRCEEWIADDERRRQRYAKEHAKRNLWWQRGADAASKRARDYYDKQKARREERRRRDGIPDAEWWEDPPPPDPGPVPDPPFAPQPGPADADDGRGRDEPEDAGPSRRPWPVRATATRTDTTRPSGAQLEPITPEQSIPPEAELEPATEGAPPMAPNLPATRLNQALAPVRWAAGRTGVMSPRDARAAARKNPAAKSIRQAAAQHLAGCSVDDALNALAIADAMLTGLGDAIDELAANVRGQGVRGGVNGLDAAVVKLRDGAYDLHRAAASFQAQKEAADAFAHDQHRLGMGRSTTWTPQVR